MSKPAYVVKKTEQLSDNQDDAIMYEIMFVLDRLNDKNMTTVRLETDDRELFDIFSVGHEHDLSFLQEDNKILQLARSN